MGGRLQPESLDEAIAKRGETALEYYMRRRHAVTNGAPQHVERYEQWFWDWFFAIPTRGFNPAPKAEVGGHNVHDDVDVSGL